MQYTCGCYFATTSTAQCGEVLQNVEESPKAARFAAQSLAFVIVEAALAMVQNASRMQ
jgi:hypothetical protein